MVMATAGRVGNGQECRATRCNGRVVEARRGKRGNWTKSPDGIVERVYKEHRSDAGPDAALDQGHSFCISMIETQVGRHPTTVFSAFSADIQRACIGPHLNDLYG